MRRFRVDSITTTLLRFNCPTLKSFDARVFNCFPHLESLLLKAEKALDKGIPLVKLITLPVI
jgi:hypothetical protein